MNMIVYRYFNLYLIIIKIIKNEEYLDCYFTGVINRKSKKKDQQPLPEIEERNHCKCLDKQTKQRIYVAQESEHSILDGHQIEIGTEEIENQCIEIKDEEENG